MRELVKIRQGFRYFTQNKLWIISLLYVSAIVKDFIWFSTFGVNILSYVSIQDTFISFLNHTMILIVLIINYIFFQLLFSKAKKRFPKIIKSIIIIGTSIVYFFIFKKPVSLLVLLIIIVSIYSLHKEKKYILLLSLSLIFLIGFSTIEPLTQGILNKTSTIGKNLMQFKWNESNMDYYSFTYENSFINTELEKYFLIGNTKDYFFIFDREIDKTLVINKGDCKNIQAEFKVF